jgi:hypothetical protein
MEITPHNQGSGQLQPVPPPINADGHAVVKFVGLAFLFNALLWLFGLFVQIRGWIDVTASYVVLLVMWVVGVAICLAVASQVKLPRRWPAIIVSSLLWASALAGLNAVAPKSPQQDATKRALPTTDRNVVVEPSYDLHLMGLPILLVPSASVFIIRIVPGRKTESISVNRAMARQRRAVSPRR